MLSGRRNRAIRWVDWRSPKLLFASVGGTDAELGYVSSFVWNALVFPLALVACSIAILTLLRGLWLWKNGTAQGSYETGVVTNNQRLRRLPRVIIGVATVLALGVGFSHLAESVNLFQYLKSQMSSVSMSGYYVAPDLMYGTTLHATLNEPDVERPLNLITIYLESIEDPMGESGVFNTSLLEPVETVTEGWARIDDLQEYQGGGWTMAGLVGMECGIPLRGAGVGETDIDSNDIGQAAEQYLPGATCIGDVLDSAGYTSVFLGGADADFASKERYLRAHGYDDVKDLKYWLDAGESELSGWGLSDRALFERAKEEVVTLREQQVPYQLSILTLDSHEPAHMFEYCEGESGSELELAIHCSMRQVAEFIDFLDQEGVLQDTVVVLVGDHQKMLAEGGPMWDELSQVEDRPIFNRFWSPKGTPLLQAGRDQLSVLATTLELLGLGRSDQQAGLGLSAFALTAPEGSALSLNRDDYEELLWSRSSDLYRALWAVEGHVGADEIVI